MWYDGAPTSCRRFASILARIGELEMNRQDAGEPHAGYVRSAHCSLLRRVITIARAHGRILDAAQLHGDLAKLTIASLVRGIVTKAVLRANLVGDLRKGRARVLQTGGCEILSA